MIKPESLINDFKICGLYPWDANAVVYSKCLGSTTTANRDPNFNISSTAQHEKLMSFATFQTIIGNEMLGKFENTTNIQDINQLKLYNIWKYFQELNPDKITFNSKEIPSQNAAQVETECHLMLTSQPYEKNLNFAQGTEMGAMNL